MVVLNYLKSVTVPINGVFKATKKQDDAKMKITRKILLSFVGCSIIMSLCDIAKEPTWLAMWGCWSFGLYLGLTDI